MTTIARCQIYIQTSGDITYQQIANILPSPNSVAEAQVRKLLPGNNEVMIVESGIPPLAAAGYTLRGLLIVPEPGNATPLTLKGATTDLGITLNQTDPTFLAVNATSAIYLFNPSANPVYIKFVWI